MEKHAEGVAETRVAIENHAGSAADTRKGWIAPELRKLDIAEITANGDFHANDAVLSS